MKNGRIRFKRLQAIRVLVGVTFCFCCIDSLSSWRCHLGFGVITHLINLSIFNFSLLSLSLSLSSSFVLMVSRFQKISFIFQTVLSCLCPCCCCCVGLANMAVGLMKLPFKIITWFTDQIPC
ncbi:hypothetical protein RHSIM_Rhsim04G0071100 [Rhododendron simsii]|uniref:Uncharacterized protein n=1 Tax=Rhododendron simsii TaxID=118357 RepID=A0A834LM51_RHOSS|nr:hypothetical protein RHSIM_Rhsim04G0071100 [Rhododendron simsii]